MKLYTHLVCTLIFICLVSLYIKVSKVQRDVETAVLILEEGICNE